MRSILNIALLMVVGICSGCSARSVQSTYSAQPTPAGPQEAVVEFQLLVQVPVDLPPDLVHAKAKGSAWIEILVDDAGGVTPNRVIETTHESFAMAACDALRKWKFKPATYNGVPQSSSGRVFIEFDATEDHQVKEVTVTQKVEAKAAQPGATDNPDDAQ